MKFLAVHKPTGRGFSLDESLKLVREYDDAQSWLDQEFARGALRIVNTWASLENRWSRPNYPEWFYSVQFSEFEFLELSTIHTIPVTPESMQQSLGRLRRGSQVAYL